MKTIMRVAFETLAAQQPNHPWVQKRLRHLLDRSKAGVGINRQRRRRR